MDEVVMADTEKKDKSFDKDAFLQTMRDRRSIGETAEDHNRVKAIKTTDFVYPTEDRGQWPQTIFEQRNSRGLPCLTINRLPAFINQVIGDHLTNRPQIKVKPAGLLSDQQGASNREGIIRQSEQVSRAKFIIDQAYKTMYVSGYPTHCQINTKYVAEDTFDQEIIWEAIEDQFSVIRDPYAKEPDGRDANWIFILETISNDEFKRRYPGQPIPSDQIKGLSDYVKWFSKDSVTIAIYWTRKSKPRVLCALTDGTLAWRDELSAEQLKTVEKERESEDWTTEVCTVTGSEILDKPKEKPWRWIPVVSFIPPYIMKEGKKWYRAGAEDSIDPQRFYNYWKSLNVAQIKPRPPIVTAAMIKGLEANWWDRKDKSDLEYLPVNITDGQQLPQWPQPPQISTAIVQEENAAIEDIKATFGMWNPSLGASEQSLSGKAIGKLQMAGDKGNMEYVNSLVRALTLIGDIILDMNPHVHDTEREINVLGFDGTPGTLKINRKRMTPEGEVIENDMTVGKYRCVVDVGPSFTTQRQEAVDAMAAISQGNPQLAAAISPFMAKLGDWPYADRIFKVLVAIQPANLQPLYNDQPQNGEQEPDPRMAQMQQAFEQQMQGVQQAIQELQTVNQKLQQEEQSRMAKIAADREMNAEKMALEREKVQADIALRREQAQADFEIRMQELEMKRRESAANLELADKKATAELLHKERLADAARTAEKEQEKVGPIKKEAKEETAA